MCSVIHTYQVCEGSGSVTSVTLHIDGWCNHRNTKKVDSYMHRRAATKHAIRDDPVFQMDIKSLF